MILTSSCSCSNSSLGGASTRVDHVWKLPCYASIWWFTVQYRRLTLASNVGSGKYVEGLNCPQSKWEVWDSYGLGMVTGWKITKKKNRILWNMVPFFISYHHPKYTQRRLDTYAAHVIVHRTQSDSASVIACFTFLPQQPRSHVNMAWDQG